jgi:hypothetical protein
LRPLFFQVWSETKLNCKSEMVQLDIPILNEEGFLHMLENYDLNVIKNGGYPYLMHWAGAVRIPYLKSMSHSHILYFFEREYFKKLVFGKLRRIAYELYCKYLFYKVRGLRKLKGKLLVKTFKRVTL